MGKSFKDLFKKYRLRAEFATLSELRIALEEKGFICEESILSHWQNGSRIPNRSVLLKLIQIFSNRQSIQTLEQANEFLDSANEGYLTVQELKKINFNDNLNTPFLVPNKIDSFTGREQIIKNIKQKPPGSITLIYGQAGVGKSALAIQLGYILKSKYPDGVLWYRLDTSDPMDILLSIAFAFGKDISLVQDREIRASMVRRILEEKRVLLIFDNVESKNDLGLLLPNNKTCSTLITSQYSDISISPRYTSLLLDSFNEGEVLLLFKNVLGEKYTQLNRRKLILIAEKVGYLPLALHILARELKKGKITPNDLIDEINEDKLDLQELKYGDKNLYLAINFSYSLLDSETRKIFLSLAIFNGKDFSLEAIAAINELPVTETKRLLNNLQNISLIENSSSTRYRIHTMVKKFLRTKFDKPELFLKAAKYYEASLGQYDKSVLKSYPNLKQESDNVLYIFRKCYELQYWDEVISLWGPLESLADSNKQLNKSRYFYNIIKSQKTAINLDQKIVICILVFLILFWIFLYTHFSATTIWSYIFGLIFGLVPLVGGVIGIKNSFVWGQMKNSLGKSIFFLSCGSISWGVGNLFWSYYNFFQNNTIPYPSLSDINYILSYPFWTIGIINLPHAVGGKFNLRKKYKKILLLIPILVLSISYYLVSFATKSNLIFAPITSLTKLFFDIAYPVSDAIILTAALFVGISFRFFGGKFKLSIYSLLFGFGFMYIGDFLFSYTTTAKIYYTGSMPDLFFTCGLCFLVFGVLGFNIHDSDKLE